MELIHTLIDFILHFDVHLDFIIQNYHGWTYLILFLIIFIETGLVIMPFLPGDSLLFAVGAFTARGSFDFFSIAVTLIMAAILGDNLNYFFGKFIGPKIFYRDGHESIFLNKKHLEKANLFYEKHGPKTVILARFIPILRTFAPFVAGIGAMTYKKFISFSALGYFFGNLAFIQNNFKYVMIAIILISVLPGVLQYFRENKKKKA